MSFLRKVYYDQWLLRTWLEVEYAVSYTIAHYILLVRYSQFAIPTIFLYHVLTRKAGEVSLVIDRIVLDHVLDYPAIVQAILHYCTCYFFQLALDGNGMLSYPGASIPYVLAIFIGQKYYSNRWIYQEDRLKQD